MINVFRILAAFLIVMATYFYLGSMTDYAFAAGVLAICSFMISVRFKLKDRVRTRDASKPADLDP